MAPRSHSDELGSNAELAFGGQSDASQVRSSGDSLPIPGPARIPPEALALRVKTGPFPAQNDGSRSAPGERSESLPAPVARFAGYDVLGRIAIGGMAEIYLGREPVEGGALRHVAIKVLRRQPASAHDTYFEELFRREGRIASQLVHPNICHIYCFGKWSGHYYIAMEWVDGVSLRALLQALASRGRPLEPSLAASIATQVAGALDYAHNARNAWRKPLQIVHRDVNPQNIMLRYDGVVKLLDFGVAHVAEPQGDSRSDTVKGKFDYMAPEQLVQKPLDGRADVFALGVCLYEMLSGTRLYKRDSLRATVQAVLDEPAPSLRARLPWLAPELDEIVQRALAKQPEARFANAAELQAALEGFLARSGEVVSARRIATLMESLYPHAQREPAAFSLFSGPDVAERLAALEIGAELAFEAATERPSSRALSRRAGRRIALALLAAAALAVLAWAWSSRGAGPARTTRAASARGHQRATPPEESAERAERGPAQSSGRAHTPADGAPEALPAAVASEQPSTPDAPSAVKPEDPLAKRRRRSPGFVARPGF